MWRPRAAVRAASHAVSQANRVASGHVLRRSYANAAAPQVGPITPVEKIILDTIKANGPVSYASYMQMCLSHPTEGYYMNSSNPIYGIHGDFITSPEISQVFGELAGIWLVNQYLSPPPPKIIQLIELGPGRGTLMVDILRVLSQLPQVEGIQKRVHLVETSQTLREVQNKTIGPISGLAGASIQWHSSLDAIHLDDTAFTMVIAHEFFDALPFYLIEKTRQGWQEVTISSAPDLAAKTVLRTSKDSNSAKLRADLSVDSTRALPSSRPRFRPVLSTVPSPMPELLGRSSPRFDKIPVGSRIEVSPGSFRTALKIGDIIAGNGRKGAALIVDYGDKHAFGNSFRAFKEHKIVDPFYLPGQCDLTVNVDFAYLAEAVATTAAISQGPLTQRDFLTRMGIDVRLKMLKDTAPPERRQLIEDAGRRLVDPTGMGKQYMVMGLTSPGDPTLPPWAFPFMSEDGGPERGTGA